MAGGRCRIVAILSLLAALLAVAALSATLLRPAFVFSLLGRPEQTVQIVRGEITASGPDENATMFCARDGTPIAQCDQAFTMVCIHQAPGRDWCAYSGLADPDRLPPVGTRVEAGLVLVPPAALGLEELDGDMGIWAYFIPLGDGSVGQGR